MEIDLVIENNVIKSCNKDYDGDVILANSIVEIDEKAFYNATLKSIDMSQSSIHTINKYAFAFTTNLQTIKFSSKLQTIGDHAFTGCSVQSISLPSSIETIEYAAFENCFNLNKIEIDNSNTKYKTFNNYLYDSSNILIRAPISCTIENMEDKEFIGIAESAFSRTNIRSFKANNKLKTIYSYAFFTTYFLKIIDLSEAKVTIINHNMFKNAIALEELRLPITITELSYKLFYESNIRSFAIPASVIKIDPLAFQEAPYLENVFYYGETRFNEKFNLTNTPNLKKIYVIKSYQFDKLGGLDVIKDAEYYLLYKKITIECKLLNPFNLFNLYQIFLLP